jgi:hypothetical protein
VAGSPQEQVIMECPIFHPIHLKDLAEAQDTFSCRQKILQ